MANQEIGHMMGAGFWPVMLGYLLLTALAAGLLGHLIAKRKGSGPLQAKNEMLQSEAERLKKENLTLVADMASKNGSILALEKDKSGLLVSLKNLEDRLSRDAQEQKKLQELFHGQMENLAHKIVEDRGRALSEANSKTLQHILGPLKERLFDFQKKIEDTYEKESREVFSLKNELQKMLDANRRMETEAHNLTKALKGDVKVQGNWGEVILERILESSGLRAGEEYTTQGEGLGLKSDEGKAQRPDVIVNLPEGKHIIVDSKVSLLSYERWSMGQEEDDILRFAKEFASSVKSHVDGLAGKKYNFQEKLITPDFVLLFMPIEGAFSLVLQKDQQIFNYAWEKGIVIVSPTTLLATLKTIASIWKRERQNKNTQKIALEAGKLYDKFVAFVSDMEKIGEGIKKTEEAWSGALNKLHLGRGNLVGRAESLRLLGAKNQKTMPENFLEEEVETDMEQEVIEDLQNGLHE